MGKVYARAIHNCKKTINDVPTRYIEETKTAYLELFGTELKWLNQDKFEMMRGRIWTIYQKMD